MTMMDAFVVEKYTDAAGDERSAWHQIGRARAHADGKGHTLYLIPGVSVSGQVVLRDSAPKQRAENTGNANAGRQAPTLSDVGLDGDSAPLPYLP